MGAVALRRRRLALSRAMNQYGGFDVWGGLSAPDRRELRPLWIELRHRLAERVEVDEVQAVAS